MPPREHDTCPVKPSKYTIKILGFAWETNVDWCFEDVEVISLRARQAGLEFLELPHEGAYVQQKFSVLNE